MDRGRIWTSDPGLTPPERCYFLSLISDVHVPAAQGQRSTAPSHKRNTPNCFSAVVAARARNSRSKPPVADTSGDVAAPTWGGPWFSLWRRKKEATLRTVGEESGGAEEYGQELRRDGAAVAAIAAAEVTEQGPGAADEAPEL